MKEIKYYDSLKKRLIHIKEEATSDYWDRFWDTTDKGQDILKHYPKRGRYGIYPQYTRKYLCPNDGPILEGGCGSGDKVWVLNLNGYKCIGVDNAKKTIQFLQDNVPQLDIRIGDLRSLDFPDNYFAGYWSNGIIEHLWCGYEDIANEMLRVIIPGGYLFLTFPYMSYFRKIKAKFRFYEEIDNKNIANFYQFVLNEKDVIKDFEELGFKLIKKKPYNLFSGIKNEIQLLMPIVNLLLKCREKNFFTKVVSFILESILSKICGFMFSHEILLVFRKTSHN